MNNEYNQYVNYDTAGFYDQVNLHIDVIPSISPLIRVRYAGALSITATSVTNSIGAKLNVLLGEEVVQASGTVNTSGSEFRLTFGEEIIQASSYAVITGANLRCLTGEEEVIGDSIVTTISGDIAYFATGPVQVVIYAKINFAMAENPITINNSAVVTTTNDLLIDGSQIIVNDTTLGFAVNTDSQTLLIDGSKFIATEVVTDLNFTKTEYK